MNSMTVRGGIVLVAGVCFGAIGCGPPPTGGVSGKITIKGEAPKLQGLEITFIAPSGQIVGCPIDEEGNYSATGVPAGQVKVGFSFTRPNAAPSKEKSRFPGKGDAKGNAEPAHDMKNPIPERLRDGSTSNLTVEVLSGKSQPFDYDIK